MPISRLLLRLFVTLIAAATGVVAGAQDSRIANTATLRWTDRGTARSLVSNTVSLARVRGGRPTKLSFRLPAPNRPVTGARCDPGSETPFTFEPVDPQMLAESTPLAAIDLLDPFYVVLDAEGENRDPNVRETVLLDSQIGARRIKFAFLETAPDSGIFAGGTPAIAMNDIPGLAPCTLPLKSGERFTLRFNGSLDSAPTEASLLIDPVGRVFDSSTGALVDGALVEMIDLQGNPATVFGDDGISRYPSTMISGRSVTDASGRVYPAQPGRYRFPLAPPGQYRLRVTPPGGYVAPSVATPDALAQLRHPSGDPFTINAASFGGILTLDKPDPFVADIPLDRIGDPSTLLLDKTASVRTASPGDPIQYRLRLTNRDSHAATGLRLTDRLPTGLRYRLGSIRGAADPQTSSDGRRLDWSIPDLAPGASAEFTYLVTVAPGAPIGEAVNRATVRGTTLYSNEAAASVRLRPLLFTDAMTIIGRVTEGACGDPSAQRKGIPGIRLLMEDGTFVVTDKDGLYHFEGVRPGTHVVQLDAVSIPATHAAIACDRDTRQARNPLSRFVEGLGGLTKRIDFQLRPTGKAAAAAASLPIAVADDAVAAGNRDWLTGATPGTDWLFPAADHNPRAPSVRVAIKHAAGQRVALTLDGTPVEPLTFDGTEAANGIAVSKWSGLPLHAGDNRLAARVLGANGDMVATLDRVVHFAGAPVRAVVDAGTSRLAADGLTPPLVAVRLFDAAGHPVRAGTPLPFRVAAPHAPAADPTRPGENVAIARVVGDDGIAFVPLAPTTQAGQAHVTVTLADERATRDVPLDAWLTASAKDWIVVGFGRGTLAYDTLSRHGRDIPRDSRDRITADGQLALYAKGRIKGSWLATLAYDSDRRRDIDRGRLGTIDPDRYYTVYGDGTDQGYDAATAGKLYLRLERRQFVALFGDFETGMTDTQLTRFSRTLTGAKVAFDNGRLAASGFAAESDTLYARDEIVGSGLSGPYRLSRRGIVPNTDKLAIETRDRLRPQLVKNRQMLTRHIDYDIDTDLGTVRFRQPILSRDSNRDPVVIVAEYEVEGGRGGRMVAGGRVVARTADRKVEVGAAGIRDETTGAGALMGVDLKVTHGATVLRAEAATGGITGLKGGLGLLAEVEHHSGGLDILAYARAQELGFGLGQQNFVEAGTFRTGIDGRVALTDALSLTGTGWYQEQLDGLGRRTAADARLEWQRAWGTLFVGGQLAIDTGIDGGDRRSALLTLGGRRGFWGDKLVLAAQTQVAPTGDKAAGDFPVRHQVTAAVKVADGVRLLGGYEIAQGADYTAHTAQAGFDVAPWKGAKLAATLNDQQMAENGGRVFAQYGLSQSLPIGPRWTVDASLDASSTLSGRVDPGAAITPFQQVDAGLGGSLGNSVGGIGGGIGGNLTGAFTAVTLGAGYRGPLWRWNGRIEYRNADEGDRWGITSTLVRALGTGRTLASSIKAYRIGRSAIGPGAGPATFASADLAFAWRPLDSAWSVLDRLEVRHEDAAAGVGDGNVIGVPSTGTGQRSTRVVNNLSLNWRSGAEGDGHSTEIALYHGGKYVDGRVGDDRYTGFIDAVGLEVRRDISPRFDLGLQASVSHAWREGAWSFSAGPSIGVSPVRDLWVTAGYNVAGYRDRDFADDRYTRAGPYVTLRMKVDQSLFGLRRNR